MLLSFAQFEREVTGERIRDKIAASKRRGLWMGGHTPLGYEPDGRTLAVVKDEAETVRTLFRLYLELGSVRRVQEEARRLGLRSKVRRGVDRRMRGGRPFGRGHLYHLLKNPLYIGRIPHNGESHPGQHPAIVDLEMWEAVQQKLAAKGPSRRARSGRRSPLQGKLFDEAGIPLVATHTVKSGRRYRYYVSREGDPAPNGRTPPWRLPAREIERLVEEAVATLFSQAPSVARAGPATSDVSSSGTVGCAPLDGVQRIELEPESMALTLDLSNVLGPSGAAVRHVLPIQIRRRGVETRLVLPGHSLGSSSGRTDPALVKAVVRGRVWFEAIASGRVRSITELAKIEGVTRRYVGRLLPLAFLAPDLVAKILSGTQPVELTAESLTKGISLPVAWADQRAALGV